MSGSASDVRDDLLDHALGPAGSALRTDQLRALMHSERSKLVRGRVSSLTKVVITGARSNSGRYIASALWDAHPGLRITNLTSHPEGREWATGGDGINKHLTDRPFSFDDPATLRRDLSGADVLFLTYWERSPPTAEEKAAGTEWPALTKVRILIDAAAEAGVRRVVYVSHTRPDLGSTAAGPDIGYIVGKQRAEEYLRDRMPPGTSVACVRPCCIFSDTPGESVVVNNMAAVMRRMPLFLVHRGARELFFQPVHVRDLAAMAVDLATRPVEEALGPDPAHCCDSQKVAMSQDGRATDLGSLDAVSAERPNVLEFLGTIRAKMRGSAVLPFPAILPALPGWLANTWLIPEILNTLLDDDFVDTEEFWIMHRNVACSAHARDPALVAAEERLAGLEDPSSLTDPEVLAAVRDTAARLPYWGQVRFSEWVASSNDLGAEYINSYQRYYRVSGRREYMRRRRSSEES